MHRLMVLSRVFDQACCELANNWFPAEGEEATVIGSFFGLKPDDYAAAHYRGTHIVYHMRGAELWRMACAAIGKADTYTGGRGLAHCGPADMGCLPWVGGDIGPQIAQATGVALAFKYRKQSRVVVNAFGDGMSTRGDFHEALNIAGIHKLPIVYVVHNNQYSISTHSTRFLANQNLVDHAKAYDLRGVTVDGNDLMAVYEAVTEAMELARKGEPSLIEAKTWRVKGHWSGDATPYREHQQDLIQPKPDPIPQLEKKLIERGIGTAEVFGKTWQTARDEVAAAVEKANQSPLAETVGIGFDKVFAEREGAR